MEIDINIISSNNIDCSGEHLQTGDYLESVMNEISNNNAGMFYEEAKLEEERKLQGIKIQ